MTLKLILTRKSTGDQFEINGRTHFGRAEFVRNATGVLVPKGMLLEGTLAIDLRDLESHVVLTDNVVSRYHAIIEPAAGGRH